MARRVNLSVALIRYTEHPEAAITAAAKLCYSSHALDEIVEKSKLQDNDKFIKMLIKLGHLSPLEHASFTFGIDGVSRALLAQITRHRIASFSVRSQRYVPENEFGYIVPPSVVALGESAVNKFEEQMNTIAVWYNEWQQALGGKGEGANEDARFVLPNAAETKIIMTMNARELMHFFTLRCCERAQWEIRKLAWKMLELVLPIAPNIFVQEGPPCVKRGCTEGKKACGIVMQVIDHWEKVAKGAIAITGINVESIRKRERNTEKINKNLKKEKVTTNDDIVQTTIFSSDNR